MKLKKTYAGSIALGAILGLSLLGSSDIMARAEAAPAPAASNIAVVDEDKLLNAYKAYRDALDVLDKKKQDLKTQLMAREFLSTEEATPFDAIFTKATRTPAEEAQIKTLVDSGTAKRAEYSGLIAKATRTDVENARIKTLEELAKGNAPKMDSIVTDLNKTVDAEQQATDKKFTDKATDVISQVANDKKILMVVHPLAVIWYSPTIDITDEVIKRLNG